MQLQWTEYVGFAAGAITTAAYVPQVWKTWRSKSAKDISLAMCLFLTLGIGLWLFYGVAIVSWPVIAANAVTLILLVALLRMKILYGRGSDAPRR